MDRFKNFNATGIAPDGRLYAGDLNLFQDLVAALSDFAQTIDVATLRVGDSSLQVLKYGSGEFRMTGALRTDGIMRGLGGLYGGEFTETQRDAIVSGSAPKGLIILNTTAGEYQWNSGTDGARVWSSLGGGDGGSFPIGAVYDWPWDESLIDADSALCYGQNLARTTYADLHAIAAASSYPHGNGDGSTTFGMPDYRGRVGVGRDNMGGSAANRVTVGGSGITGSTVGAVGGAQTVALSTSEIPSHNHTITDGGHTHANSLTLPNHIHSHSLTTPAHIHSHTLTLPTHAHSHSLTLPNHVHSVAGNGKFLTDTGTGTVYDNPFASGASIGHPNNTDNPTSNPSINGSVGNNSTAPSIAGAIGNPTTSPAIDGAIGNPTTNPALGGAVTSATTGISLANTGGGSAHNNMPPSIIVHKVMRVK